MKNATWTTSFWVFLLNIFSAISSLDFALIAFLCELCRVANATEHCFYWRRSVARRAATQFIIIIMRKNRNEIYRSRTTHDTIQNHFARTVTRSFGVEAQISCWPPSTTNASNQFFSFFLLILFPKSFVWPVRLQARLASELWHALRSPFGWFGLRCVACVVFDWTIN